MLVTTSKQFHAAVSYLNQHEELVIDTETNGLDWAKDDKVCGVPVLAGDKSFYFPFRHGEGPNLPESYLRQLAVEVFTPERVQGGFNYSFDEKMLAKEGKVLAKKSWDSILSAHLLNENEESFKMEELGKKYLNEDAGNEEDQLIDLLVERYGGSRKTAKGNLWRLPAKLVAPYGEQDLRTTRGLRDLHAPELKDWKFENLIEEIYEWSRYVTEMELRGIRLDHELCDILAEEAEHHASALRKLIQKDAGYAININSAPQVQAWLGVKSTAKLALQDSEDERAKWLIDYRQYNRANTAYYDPYREYVDSDGILRYGLNLIGTVTSRLSCSNKHTSTILIQGVPRETDKYKVKDVFMAPDPDDLLVEMDYSQAELRLAAHYSRDVKLTEIIMSGVNMHDVVSEELNMDRSDAKRVNFSAWYGIGPLKYSQNYGVPLPVAKKYLANYHGMFTGIKRLMRGYEEKAEQQGYIRLFSGRARHFNTAFAPTHTASNGLIQGGVAEMIRIAAIKIRRKYPHVKILAPVHDSLLFAIPKSGFMETVIGIRKIMQTQPWCSIPIFVDVKYGTHWGTTMKKLPRSGDGVEPDVIARCTDPGLKEWRESHGKGSSSRRRTVRQ